MISLKRFFDIRPTFYRLYFRIVICQVDYRTTQLLFRAVRRVLEIIIGSPESFHIIFHLMGTEIPVYQQRLRFLREVAHLVESSKACWIRAFVRFLKNPFSRSYLRMASLVSFLLVLYCSMAVIPSVNMDESLGERDNWIYHSYSDNYTNKKFLRIIMLHLPPDVIVTRNSTGHVTNVQGVGMLVLEWLSRALNLNYVLLEDNIYSVEDNAVGKGLMTAIVQGRADVILGSVVMTASRYKNLNFPYPFVISQFGLVIPMPRAQVNVAAVWKPFQPQVWIFFIVSLLAAIAFLSVINYGISVIDARRGMTNQNQRGSNMILECVIQTSSYVIGVFFSQSITVQRETSRNQKLTIRLLAGAWCVTCFVLVTAYSSVLISFITSPNYKPLIDSIHDIPKNPEVKITVDRGWSPDLLFTNAEGGIFKYFGDQLREDPELRCRPTAQCLDKVRNGSYVYTQGYLTLKNIIGIDLKQTGRCDFTIAKERFFSFCAGLAVPKNVDIESFNRGMLRAHEGGFIDLWYDRNVADASRCLNPLRKHSTDKIRLKLGALSGAFIVLAFGLSLSVLVILLEIIYNRYCK